MTPPIERIRYYDGEYLRAFDFDDEQSYHIEMRRRLNMGLHLYGIVEGLQLTSQNEGGITQVSISAGMAIDPFGREIFLLAPYTFDDPTDLESNRITVGGNYQVWIQYTRVSATPPSVGYAACNSSGEMTRWLETCKVVLLKSTNPITVPAVTDDISEGNPDTDTSNGVYLGTISVTPFGTNGTFATVSQPPSPVVVYIGLRAQQIQPPNFPDKISPPFDITNEANSLNPPIGVDVPSNLFVDQNLIVGPNFELTPPSGVTPPAAGGNVKVAGDLFVQGDICVPPPVGSPPNTSWQTLSVTTPDVLVGVTQTVTTPTTEPSGAYTFPVISRVQNIGTATATASIAGIQFNQGGSLSSIVGATGLLQIQITNVSAVATSTPGTCSVTISWMISPTLAATSTTPFANPVQSLWFSYVVVCYPAS